MKIRSFAILYFLYVSLSYLLVAQTPDYGVAVREMPLLDRMPSRSVLNIMQDRDGEIWIGTDDGLCRADGYSVRVYRPNNPHSGVIDNRITSATQSADGAVWFGTMRGLYRVDKRTQSVAPVSDVKVDNAEVRGVYATSDGSVWVSIYGTLLRFGANGTRIKDYQIQWQNVPSSVSSLYEDRQGRIWITVRDGGICRYDIPSDSWVYYPWPYREGSVSMLQDRVGDHFYVGVWLNGIARFNPDAATADDMFTMLHAGSSDHERDNAYLNMAQDDVKGYLWVTTINGLQVYDTSDRSALRQVDMKNFTLKRPQMLTTIFKDRNGNLWVGCLNVPSFVVSVSRNIITYPLAAVHNAGGHVTTVSSLCYDDAAGLIWFFQERHKLYLYDVEADEAVDEKPDLFDDAHKDIGASYMMTKAHRGRGIWVADTHSHEIYRLRNDNRHIVTDEHIHIAGALPRVMSEDASGRLWIGTNNGLYVYNSYRHELKTADDIGQVVDVTLSPEGETVAVAYDRTGASHIYKYRNGKRVKSYRFRDDCTAAAVTPDNSLWVGTRLGDVWRLVAGQEPQRLSATGKYVPSGYVHGLATDSSGHLWIQTEQQLTELDPATLSMRHYYVNEGHIDLFSFQPHALSAMPSGALLAGGAGGISRIASTMTDAEAYARPEISYVRVDGADVPLSCDGLEVGSGKHIIEIELGTPDHIGAQRRSYAYRIDGGEWVSLMQGDNAIRFDNVRNGRHILELRNAESSPDDADMTATLVITHRAAFYETWWFIAILLIFCGVVIIAALRRKENEHIGDTVSTGTPDGSIDEASTKADDKSTGSADDRPVEDEEYTEIETNAAITNVSSTHDEELMQRIMACVERNITNTDYGISELSQDVNMSRMNLYRKIHAITGQTPTDFVKSVRLKKAADMLRENKYSIVEVAYAVGYSSPSYFTRSFKSEFGLTPTQYIGHAHHGKA